MFTADGKNIRLGRQLGAGGAGTVYEVEGQSHLVAKRYHQPPSSEHVARLKALSQRADERLTKIAAWPTDVLFDAPDGKVIGFLMPRVDGASEIHTLHSPKSRLQKFPDATWAFLIHVAANIARAVATVHEAGFVIGDVNPKNILVTRQGTVALLDCDSFQFTTDDANYRCEAGFPEYTPPELQGVVFRDVERTPQHDAFGLAVIIFQLLFLGRHPFAGRFLGEGEMSLGRAIAEQRFAYGENAPQMQMHPPTGTLPPLALPAELFTLFEQAFLTVMRPTPKAWLISLEKLAANLNQCELHNGHCYSTGLSACPWCELESATGVQLFQFSTRLTAPQKSALDIGEILAGIAKVTPLRPDDQVQYEASALKVAKTLIKTSESPFAQEIAAYQQSKHQAFGASLFLAIVIGLLLGFFTPIWPFLFFAPWLFQLIQQFLNAYFSQSGASLAWPKPSALPGEQVTQIQTLFSAKPEPESEPEDKFSLTARIRDAQTKTQNKLKKLEQAWQQEASTEALENARHDLLEKCELYQNWPRERARRLSAFEAEQRETQLNHYLKRCNIHSSQIEGVSDVTKKILEDANIKNAADVTPKRLQQIAQLGESSTTSLLQWRRTMELPFTFDARRIHQDARLKLAREIERDYQRLETRLRTSGDTLQRLRKHIENRRQELQPKIAQLQHTWEKLEQSQAQLTPRSGTRWITTVVLIGAFLLSWGAAKQFHSTAIDPVETLKRTINDNGMRGDLAQSEIEKARKIYSEGVALRRNREYQSAIHSFEAALKIDPNLTAAYDELSSAWFMLGDYPQALTAAQTSLSRGETFEAHRNVGRAYAGQKIWTKAKTHLAKAVRLMDRSVWDYDEVGIFSDLGETLKHTGELPEVISVLEADAQRDPELALVKFQLGCYYLWADNRKGAEKVQQMLKDQNETLAENLSEKLMQRFSTTKTN